MEARTKRAAVYEAYLAAANADIAPAFRAAAMCTKRRCNHEALERTVGPPSERLIKAEEQVALYGSDRATNAAARLVNAVPILVLFKREIAQPPGANFGVRLESAYQDFARIMCEEISAEPRSHCSQLKLPTPPTLVVEKPATEARENVDGGRITIYE